MRGAAYLTPLLAAEASNAETQQQQRAIASVAPVVIDPRQVAQTPSDGEAARLGALLRGVESELVSQREWSAGVSQEAVQLLPHWAQIVMGTQSVEHGMTHSHHKKRPTHVYQKDHSSELPRKKPRAFQKKDHLRIAADGLDDLPMASSQDTEGGDEEEEGPLRSMFTQEERTAEHVDKYSAVLAQLVETIQQRNEEREAADEEFGLVDLFTTADVKALVQSLKVMKKSALIEKCDPDLLLSLVGMTDKQVRIGLGIDVLGTMSLDQGDEEWQASGIGLRLMARVQSSLDVGICEMLIMSTPDIDRRIMSEETIDNCSLMLSHVIQRLMLPCIDPSSSLAATSSSARTSLDNTFVSPRTERTPTSGHKRSGAKPLTVKHNKNAKKAMDRLLPVVCEFMEQLARLISSVRIADRWILHFSSMMIKFFVLEFSSYATSLQQSGLLVLRAIFQGYETHRELVLEELVTVMLQLPTTKRNLRTVKLTGSTATVQMITTLIVALVQATVSTPLQSTANSAQHDPTLLAEDTEIDDSDSQARMRCARATARTFVMALIKECMKKNEERDNRVVLEYFLEDLLAMFGRPDWAGAEVLLEVLGNSLAGILSTNLSKEAKKLESQYSLTALHLAGRICAGIKMNQNAASRDALDDDDYQVVYMEHEAFVKELLENAALACGDGVNRYKMVGRDIVLKHIVLSFMRRNVRDVTHEDSRRMLVTRLLMEKSEDGSTDHAAGIWRSYWETKPAAAIDSSSKLASPPLDLALRSSMQVAVSRDFGKLFDVLMSHLMALLSRGIPTFRARVMKALGGIVDVDPMLMAEKRVRDTVSQCFLDEATSVRQAAVDLVGKYVTLQPLLFDRYFDMLCDRLRDKGISVRKSVCKIFRTYLTSSSMGDGGEVTLSDDELKRRSSCMRHLVQRIGDATEEDAVKNFIIDTFQESWFGAEFSSRQLSGLNGFEDEPSTSKSSDEAPPGWSVIENSQEVSADDQNDVKKGKVKSVSADFVSPDGRVFKSAEEAWAAYRTPLVTPSSVVKNKRSKLDDTPATVSTIVEVIHGMPTMDWFVALLKRLLHDDQSTKSNGGRRISRDRSDDVSVARSRSEKIVGCLVLCLVQLEEGKELKGVTISEEGAQFLSCVKALSAFSEASPMLLSPHLEVLMVYLKGDDKLGKATEAKVQGLIVGMVSNVIAHSERVTDRIAARLDNDLKNLVFCAPPSVVGPSIKCLATLSNFTKRPPTLLFRLLCEFFKYLQQFRQLDSLANVRAGPMASLQRALFAAGQIGGALDFDNCNFDLPIPTEGSLNQLRKGSIMDALYEVYSVFLKIKGNPACTAKAVQGLGSLFMLRPRFLLKAQQETIFDCLLTSSFIEVRLQTLTSLKELLQHEEQRLEKGVTRKKSASKDKSKKGQVQGDQDGEGSLIGGVMQAQLTNVLALSLDKHVRIRSEAVSCVAVLLTQGLISPVHCIPNLFALEADQVVSIRDIAHGQLLALHEKFPTLLHQPSIQGVSLSHTFQVMAFGTSTVFALDKDKKEYCLFGRLYTSCLRPARAQRNMFLKALVSQFYEKGAMLSSNTSTRGEAAQVIDYLAYLAQFVTALPFDVEDEPLFIIYLINRHVTLKLGPILQELKKEFKALGLDSLDVKNDDAELNEVEVSTLLLQKYSDDRVNKLVARSCVGFAINLLLRIKFFLKEMYGLDNEKCQTYQPGSATKATDQSLFVPENSTLKLQLPLPADLQVEHPVELAWNLLLQTWQAAQEDQSQLDFEAHEDTGRSKKKKAPRRRKVAAKSAVPNDDEDEYVEGFDG